MFAGKIEQEELDQMAQPPSPIKGFLPYYPLDRSYSFIYSYPYPDDLFHPGVASEFPIDTLITAINSYMGFIYIQAREQLVAMLKVSCDNIENLLPTFGQNLITTFEKLNRCIGSNDKVFQVHRLFIWKQDDIGFY